MDIEKDYENSNEFYAISPDRPYKVILENKSFKSQTLHCLKYEEFKTIYELVVSKELKENLSEFANQKLKYCEEYQTRIKSSKIVGEKEIIILEFPSRDSSETIITYNILRRHENHHEYIPLGTDIDTLNIEAENFDDFVSLIWISKNQLEKISTWPQLEDINESHQKRIREYFERNVEKIKTQIKKEIAYSSHPYRTPEAMQIMAKAYVLHGINPLASKKRYNTANEFLKPK